MVAKLEFLEANPVDPTAPLTMNPGQFYDLAMHPPADLLANYPWLKLPEGASLEGFLFPATYDVAPDTTPLELLDDAARRLREPCPAGAAEAAAGSDLPEGAASPHWSRARPRSTRTGRSSPACTRTGSNPKIWPTGLLNANPTLNYANDSVWLQDPAHPIETWVDYTFWDLDQDRAGRSARSSSPGSWPRTTPTATPASRRRRSVRPARRRCWPWSRRTRPTATSTSWPRTTAAARTPSPRPRRSRTPTPRSTATRP